MPITDLLTRNAKEYPNETALVEINPELSEPSRITWNEYELVQPTSTVPYRTAVLRRTEGWYSSYELP